MDDRSTAISAAEVADDRAEIATHLGKSRKTIYAELRRGQDGEKLDRNQRPAYDPELAQRRFQANLRRRGKPQQAGT